MRQRITYIQKPSLPFHPSQTTLTRDALYVESLDAAREERVTFSFDELPSEVCTIPTASSQRSFGIGNKL
jgi:hypothetical protein